MRDLALLVIRATVGSLLAGHGAQKLFGSFGGPGLEGTSGWMESIGLRPGKQWALMAGLSEFGGGVLMVLGLFNPVGSLGAMGSMAMATTQVHWDKPIWVTEGGAELPITNMAAAMSLILSGPGRFSLDNALGIRLPRALVAVIGLLVVLAVVAYARQEAPQQERGEEEAEDQAREELAGEGE